MSDSYRVGMGQILVEGGAPRQNLDRACKMAAAAAEAGCALVVLPECLDFGWTHPSAREGALPIPGPHTDRLAAAARQAGLFLVAGLVEREGDRLYNSAVLLSPGGDILHKHRKINELDIGRTLYSTGASLSLAETALGPVAVTICADNFPETLDFARSLARMGARVLFSPCAWAVDAGHDNAKDPYGALWLGSYTTLAREHGMAVIGVSNVGWLTAGPWNGRKCIGCSLAVGPAGELLAQAPYGVDAEALVVVEITPRRT